MALIRRPAPPRAASPSEPETPVEMLLACHAQVRRFASLCTRLAEHVAAHGADTQAADAAAAILRYFDLAAPLHHADEEEDVFPALRALGDAPLAARLDALEAEHGALDALWPTVRAWLTAINAGACPPVPAALPAFASRYAAHAAREETEAFTAADRLAPETLARIGRRMRQRRGAPD